MMFSRLWLAVVFLLLSFGFGGVAVSLPPVKDPVSVPVGKLSSAWTEADIMANRGALRAALRVAAHDVVNAVSPRDFVAALKHPGGILGTRALKLAAKGTRLVGFTGILQLGAELTKSAVEWFYEELKRETGTPLDSFFYGKRTWYLAYGDWEITTELTNGPRFQPAKEYFCNTLVYSRGLYSWSPMTMTVSIGTFIDGDLKAPKNCYGHELKLQKSLADSPQRLLPSSKLEWLPIGDKRNYYDPERLPNDLRYILVSVGQNPLPEAITKDPRVHRALQNVIREYIDKHPPTGAEIENGTAYGGTLRSPEGSYPTLSQITGVPLKTTIDIDPVTSGSVGDSKLGDQREVEKANSSASSYGTQESLVGNSSSTVTEGSSTNDSSSKVRGPSSGLSSDSDPLQSAASGDNSYGQDGNPYKQDRSVPPVSDICGDFTLGRFFSYPGHYMRDIVFPCQDLADFFKPTLETLKTKFPFSLASALSGWFDLDLGDDEVASRLPSHLGVIPLDWEWLAPLWRMIKSLVGVALWVWFGYWLVDRFAPRTVI